MPQPEYLAQVESPLVHAYRNAWSRIVAEQAAIADDPARAARRQRLNELRAAVEAQMDDLDEATAEWIAHQFPSTYAAGAVGPTGVADMVWTQIHQNAVQQLSQDLFQELLQATKGVRDTTKALIRTALRSEALFGTIGGQTARQAATTARRFLEENGIHAVTYADGSRHGLSEYAEMAMRTKTAEAYNQGTLNQHGQVLFFEVFDGPNCGTASHDDGDMALGQIWDRDKCFAYPFSHPNCRRSFGPRPDILSPEELKDLGEKKANELARERIGELQAAPGTVGAGQVTEGQRAAQVAQDAHTRQVQTRRSNRLDRQARREARQARVAERATVLQAPLPEPDMVEVNQLLPPSAKKLPGYDQLSFGDKTGVGLIGSNAKKAALAQGKSQWEAEALGDVAKQKAIANKLGKTVEELTGKAPEVPKAKLLINVEGSAVTNVYSKVAEVPSVTDLIDAGVPADKAAAEWQRLMDRAVKVESQGKETLHLAGDQAILADRALGVASFDQPKALYSSDRLDTGPGGRGAWQNRLKHDTAPGEYVPVRGLNLDGRVVNGIAIRRGGITHLIEEAPGQSAAQMLDALEQQVKVVDGALSGVPEQFRGYQSGVARLRGPNPADAHWAEKYKVANFKSAATGGNGQTLFWDTDIRPGVFLHEFGHNIDSGLGEGPGAWISDKIGWTDATDNDVTYGTFHAEHGFAGSIPGHNITPGKLGVTEYGQKSGHEDFAESVRLYFADRHNGYLGYADVDGVKTSVRFADVFPERARQLDDLFGLHSDLQTPFQVAARERALTRMAEDFVANGQFTLTRWDLQSTTGAFVSKSGFESFQLSAQPKIDALLVKEAEKKAAAEAAAKAAEEAAKMAALVEESKKLTKADLSFSDKTGIGVKKSNAFKKRVKELTGSPNYFTQEVAEKQAKEFAAKVEQDEIAERLNRLRVERGLPKIEAGQLMREVGRDAMRPGVSERELRAAQKHLQDGGKKAHPLAKEKSSIVEIQNKSNIAAELGSRMNNEDDWEAFRKYANNPVHQRGPLGLSWPLGDGRALQGGRIGAFEDYTAAERQSVLDAETSRRVQTWACASGDSQRDPVAMQMAARDEFGLTGDPFAGWSHANLVSRQETEEFYGIAGDFYRRFLRHQYNFTQDELAKDGLTELSMYRGMRFNTKPEWATKGQHRPQLQPINSWSTRARVSSGFGPTSFRATIPASRILGSCRTGFGCTNELEFVVMDSDGAAEVGGWRDVSVIHV